MKKLPKEIADADYFICSFSGGKDSVSLYLELTEEYGLKDKVLALFADTGWEHEITYKYVESLKARGWNIKKIMILTMVRLLKSLTLILILKVFKHSM